MEFTWYDAIGVFGVAGIVTAYALLQFEKIRSDSLVYSSLNAIGAGLVLLSLYFDFNFPSFVVEVFWLIISLVGVGKYLAAGRK